MATFSSCNATGLEGMEVVNTEFEEVMNATLVGLRLGSQGGIYFRDKYKNTTKSIVLKVPRALVRDVGASKYGGRPSLRIEITSELASFLNDIIDFYSRLVPKEHCTFKTVTDNIRIKYKEGQVDVQLEWGDTTTELLFTPKIYTMDQEGKQVCGVYFVLHEACETVRPSKRRSRSLRRVVPETIFEEEFYPPPPVLKR